MSCKIKPASTRIYTTGVSVRKLGHASRLFCPAIATEAPISLAKSYVCNGRDLYTRYHRHEPRPSRVQHERKEGEEKILAKAQLWATLL